MAEFNYDKYMELYEAEQNAAAVAPVAGQEDLRGNTFDAFAAGMADTATLGLADEARALVRTAPGEGYVNRYMAQLEQESSYMDELARQNPSHSLAGSILGALAGGIGWGQAAKALIGTTVKGRSMLKGVDSMVKRAGVSTVAGSVEGGSYAFNENRSVPLGITTGAIFGLGGQAILGEAIPGMWRAFKGKPTKWDEHAAKEKMVNYLMSKHSDLAKDDAEAVFDTFSASLEKLGPEATIADVSEEVRATVLGIISDPASMKAGKAFMDAMSERLRLSDGRMKRAIYRVLGSDEALSPTQVSNQAATDFKTYSPEFGRILNDSDLALPAGKVAEFIEEGFTAGGITTNEADSAYKAMMKFLKRHSDLDDDGNITGTVGAVQLNGLVKQLDNLYNEATDPFAPAADKILRTQIAELRTRVKGQLDRIPGYKELNGLYSETASVANAHGVGVKLTTKKVQDWTALDSLMGEMSTTEKIALLDGVKWSLVNTIKEGGAGAAAKLLNNGVLREKFVRAFGATTTDHLLDAARSAARLSDTEELMDSARLSGLTGQVRNPLESAANVSIAGAGLGTEYVSSAGGLGAARATLRELRGAQSRQDTAFGNLASRSGPEAQALLGDTLPKVQSGPRPTDPSDLASSGLGIFSAQKLAGEDRR